MADDNKKDDHMNHFMLEHAPLFRRAINQLKTTGVLHDGLTVDESDLTPHGMVGLLKAARSWEPGTSDKKWHNFALDSVRTHMHQYIKEQDPVDPRLRREAKKLNTAAPAAPKQASPVAPPKPSTGTPEE